jgi:hypothetical protein
MIITAIVKNKLPPSHMQRPRQTTLVGHNQTCPRGDQHTFVSEPIQVSNRKDRYAYLDGDHVCDGADDLIPIFIIRPIVAGLRYEGMSVNVDAILITSMVLFRYVAAAILSRQSEAAGEKCQK